MNAKSLTLLLVLAGAAVFVAAVALRSDTSSAEESAAKQKLLPGLSGSSSDASTSDRRNAVAMIRIQRAEGGYTLHKVGDTWTIQDRGDFPVQMDQVRKLVNALGDATTIEAKTSDPAKYARLGVEDVDAPDSKSVLVTLGGQDGREIAKLIVGKQAEASGMQVSKQVYVRRAGEAQSWLADMQLDLHERATDWMAKEVVKVPQDSVRSIEIRQPDGETLLVDRPSKETKDFTLHAVPEGKEPTYPTVANSLATGLEYVNLEDVAPAGDVDFSTGTGPIARYTTFDGLVVTVTTKDQDGKAYASFVASYEAPPAAEVKPDGAEGETTAPPAAAKSADEVQAEVAKLNDRLSKWAYVISSYSRSQFGKKASEMVKDRAPATPPADPNAAEGGGDDGMGDGMGDGMDDADKPMIIPSDLPPEIRAQIKAHQEGLGNKTVDGPPRTKPEDAPVEPPQEPESEPDAPPTPPQR